MAGRAEDHGALMRAHGLRPGDPLMLLNVRFAARGGPPPQVRPQDAAAGLLSDVDALRKGALASLALDLPVADAMPTAFAVPGARSVLAAWSSSPPPAATARAGCRRIRLACRVSHHGIDWGASLSARVSGSESALLLLAGTAISAIRAHDPGLPRTLGDAGLDALADACLALAPARLLWSEADIPAASLGRLARAASIRMVPAALPQGFVACLAAGDPEGLALCGNREALADAYRAGSHVRAMLAVPPSVDLRALKVDGGIEALAALAPPDSSAPRP